MRMSAHVGGDPISRNDPFGLGYCDTLKQASADIFCNGGGGGVLGWVSVDGVDMPADMGMRLGGLSGGAVMTPDAYSTWFYNQLDGDIQTRMMTLSRTWQLNQIGRLMQLADAMVPGGLSYQQRVSFLIVAMKLDQYIDMSSLEWDERHGGYTFNVAPGVDIRDLGSNILFASGPLGVLHWGQTGLFSRDYRSYTVDLAPYSVQVTVGDRGWIDIDAHNPYQDFPLGIWRHARYEVFSDRDRLAGPWHR